jgi:hypothetical protein
MDARGELQASAVLLSGKESQYKLYRRLDETVVLKHATCSIMNYVEVFSLLVTYYVYEFQIQRVGEGLKILFRKSDKGLLSTSKF